MTNSAEIVVLDKLPFKVRQVRGEVALSERAADQSDDTTAVVMGKAEDIELVCQSINESTQSTDQILELSSRVDLEIWNAGRTSGDPEYWAIPESPRPEDGINLIEPSLHLEVLSGRPKSNVLIGHLPVAHAWQVPAVLRYGGWIECPEPEVHCALHNRWAEEYGSEIIGISSDVIECALSRKPETQEEALSLARQQFIYCPDIVHQGVRTIETLAETLRRSDYWYFWWD